MRLFSKRLTGAICAISKIFVKRWIDAIFVKISLLKEVPHKRIPAYLGTAIFFLPDPGVSGVRSMGPGLSMSVQDFVKLF